MIHLKKNKVDIMKKFLWLYQYTVKVAKVITLKLEKHNSSVLKIPTSNKYLPNEVRSIIVS
jgi:hypothetical protein